MWQIYSEIFHLWSPSVQSAMNNSGGMCHFYTALLLSKNNWPVRPPFFFSVCVQSIDFHEILYEYCALASISIRSYPFPTISNSVIKKVRS